jgi:hypothetical protein
MRRIGIGSIVMAATLLALVGTPTAQTQEEVAKKLRVEWEVLSETWARPRLVGYVYNDSEYRIGSVRLRVQTLDAAGTVVRDDLAWIYVNVPARSRSYFSVRRPEGETYRIAVASFVLIAREPVGETP